MSVKNFILLFTAALIWGTAFVAQSIGMLRVLQKDDSILRFLCGNIVKAKQEGVYDGAYKAVKMIMER